MLILSNTISGRDRAARTTQYLSQELILNMDSSELLWDILMNIHHLIWAFKMNMNSVEGRFTLE